MPKLGLIPWAWRAGLEEEGCEVVDQEAETSVWTTGTVIAEAGRWMAKQETDPRNHPLLFEFFAG
jgi:hypothetical protein